jgi:hypothetical protein
MAWRAQRLKCQLVAQMVLLNLELNFVARDAVVSSGYFQRKLVKLPGEKR